MALLTLLALTSFHVIMAVEVIIDLDAEISSGPLIPISRFFGADECNYAYFPEGQKLLSELGQLSPFPTYFRTHNLLTTGDGTPALKWGSTNAYTEDASGNPIYNWTIVDRIFDSYLSRNVKPYAQIGFMPKALSTHPDPYTFNFTPSSPYNTIYTGWAYPPTSYEKWGELVYQWVKHCIDRYGTTEVESWYWEVWNEPNIGYWQGTTEQFFELHDYGIAAVRRALPTARVGGCDVAGGSGGSFLANFLNHTLQGNNYATGGKGSPLDFVSFHAKGSPKYVNTTDGGYIQMGISAQLKNIDDAFNVIASFPQARTKPIVIGESDPDGCAACITPQYGYRNGLLYPSYTAASFVRALDLSIKHGVNLQGVLTWAFEFDNSSYFNGFRVLATNGIDKPVLNVHRMFGKMTGQRVQAISSAQVPLAEAVSNGVTNAADIGVLASLDSGVLSVFVWHYHDADLPKPDAQVSLNITGLPWNGVGELTHFRIDDHHSNSYTKWLQMGSPQDPTPSQYASLKAAGQLQSLGSPVPVSVKGGKLKTSFAIPIHSVSLLVFKPTP